MKVRIQERQASPRLVKSTMGRSRVRSSAAVACCRWRATAARVLSAKMTERLGWQFVVDNRTGGNGLIGGNIAAKAPADA